MGYAIISALLILFIILYGMAQDQLSLEKRDRKRAQEAVRDLEQSRNNLWKEKNDFYCKQKEDFQFVIKKQIENVQSKGLYSRYDPNELCRMIIENDYIIGVRCIQDIDFDHFEKTIKAALYADKGFLSIYQSDTKDQFRIDDRGKHIELTDEECAKIRNYDFNFIYDSLKLY